MSDGHLERLLAELGERAQAEIAQVESDARGRAEAVHARRASVIDARRADAIAAVEADLARRRAVALADARRRARGALLHAQHALVDRVLARVRSCAGDRLAQPASACGLERRSELLRSYAVSGDASVERISGGLRLTADGGHLSIDDTIDAWLEADRAAIAIAVCRVVESAPC